MPEIDLSGADWLSQPLDPSLMSLGMDNFQGLQCLGDDSGLHVEFGNVAFPVNQENHQDFLRIRVHTRLAKRFDRFCSATL